MEKKNRLFLLFSVLLHRSGLSPSLPSSFFSSPSSPPPPWDWKEREGKERRGLQIFASPALSSSSFGYFCPSPSGQFGKQLCFCCICQKKFVDISLDCTKRKKLHFIPVWWVFLILPSNPSPIYLLFRWNPLSHFLLLLNFSVCGRGEEKQCQTHIVPRRRRRFAQSKAQQRRLGSSPLRTDRLKFCLDARGGVFFKFILWMTFLWAMPGVFFQ